MSKIFYDHLVDLSKIDREIKKHVTDPKDREEIYRLVDEIVHHRIVGCILDKLPEPHHKEFLSKLSDKPHDESLLKYLSGKVAADVDLFIREEVAMIGNELLALIKP